MLTVSIYSAAVKRRPSCIQAQVRGSTSPGSGSRPKARARALTFNHILAAGMSRQARLNGRPVKSGLALRWDARGQRTAVLSLHGGRTGGMNWLAEIIRRAHGNTQASRWSPDFVAQGAQQRGRGIGITRGRTVGGVQQRGAVPYAATHAVSRGHPRQALAEVWPGRVTATRGFETEQAALRGGNANTAAAVRGMGHGQIPCGHSGSRPAGGAACRVREAPGITRWPKQLRLSGRGNAEFGRIGLGHDHQPGRFVTRDQGAVMIGHKIRKNATAICRPYARHRAPPDP